MRRLVVPTLLVLAFLLTSSNRGEARTWYIKPDGTGDAPTIKAGIDSAAHGDTVLVECGTYYEHALQMKSGLYLRSSTGQPDCVIIDAENEESVIYCVGVRDGAEIEGFTFTRGLAPEPLYGQSGGGGMRMESSRFTTANCAFVNNRAGNSMHPGFGGGLFCLDSSPGLINCSFSDNEAMHGGGMCCEDESVPVLNNCVFSQNSAADGGGLCCLSGSVRLAGCLLFRNSAGIFGGGLDCEAPAILLGCTVVGNSAPGAAGIFWFWDGYSELTVVNSIIAFNGSGEAVFCSNEKASVSMWCCDIYGNAGGDWVSCIAEQADMYGNFSLDPLFCDAAGDDYTLIQCSPCAPGNDPNDWNCGLIGALPVGCQGTAIEPTTWGRIKAIFR